MVNFLLFDMFVHTKKQIKYMSRDWQLRVCSLMDVDNFYILTKLFNHLIIRIKKKKQPVYNGEPCNT